MIFTHDVLTLLGLLVGLAIYYRELSRRGMLEWRIFWISMLALIGGGIGARLSVIWEHPAYYSSIAEVPLSYFISHSGKSIIGALVGGWMAVALAKKALGYTRSTGDCYAPAIPAAMMVGRVGCFLSELPLGTPTDLPWGIAVSPEAAAQFTTCPGCSGKMHPSMLYEIIFHGCALLLILRYRHKVMVQGDVLKIYLLASAIFRFLVEFVRGNPEMAWGLTSAQIALVPLTLLLVVCFGRQWQRGVYTMPPAPSRLRATEGGSPVHKRLARDSGSGARHLPAVQDEIAPMPGR